MSPTRTNSRPTTTTSTSAETSARGAAKADAGHDGAVARRPVVSPIGTLTLSARGSELTGLWFDIGPCPGEVRDATAEEDGVLDRAAAQLDEYFAGERTAFDLPLAPTGTEFQLRVWAALRTIPYGETWSYGQLATSIGNPAASRAVGLANGRNPIGIIVPCHRVIGADGSLTGFGGGIDRKQFLLHHEAPTLF